MEPLRALWAGRCSSANQGSRDLSATQPKFKVSYPSKRFQVKRYLPMRIFLYTWAFRVIAHDGAISNVVNQDAGYQMR